MVIRSHDDRPPRAGAQRVTRTTSAPKVRPERGTTLHAELLLVGRDLLRGRVAETNARPLAARIAEIGGLIHRVTVVDDTTRAIGRALREALERNPHLVVTTGGLGPAADDVTLEAVAEVLGRPLTPNAKAREHVEAAYSRLARAKVVRNAAITLARDKLCRAPVGSVVLANPRGVAPGVIHRLPGGTAIVCLPGTPAQARAVFEAALDELHDLPHRRRLAQREVEAPTADESEVRPIVDRIAEEYPGVWISSRPSSGTKGSPVLVLLETVAATEGDANAALDVVQRRLLQLASGSK